MHAASGQGGPDPRKTAEARRHCCPWHGLEVGGRTQPWEGRWGSRGPGNWGPRAPSGKGGIPSPQKNRDFWTHQGKTEPARFLLNFPGVR